MCFTLYLATNKPMPTISFDANNPSFNTSEIEVIDQALRNIFTKPYLKNLGSNEGCGCGFRQSFPNNGSWIPVINENEEILNNKDHQSLVDYILQNNQKEKSVEILACWNDNYQAPIEFRDTIKLIEILDMDFYFKENGLYTLVF
jgi:hypothetical protein